MCPQNPNTLEDISFLKPLIIKVVIIIVAKLNAIAAIAIRTITLVNDRDFENAILLAMKCDKFIHNDSETLNQK